MVKGPRLVSACGPKAVPHPQGSSAFRGMADLRVSQGLIAAQGTGAMPCQSGERQGRETPVDCQGRKPELYVDLLEVEECKTRREVSPRRPQPSGPPYPSLQLPQVSSCTSGHSAEHGLLAGPATKTQTAQTLQASPTFWRPSSTSSRKPSKLSLLAVVSTLPPFFLAPGLPGRCKPERALVDGPGTSSLTQV